MLAHVPGLKVFLPGDPRDVDVLLRAAIRDDGPVVVVENRRLYNRRAPAGDDGWEPLPPGRARVVRAGGDLTVIAWGRMVGEVQRACEDPRLDGVGVELIDLRTLVPLDLETLVDSVRATGRALVVHEAVGEFGPGAEIAMRLTEELLYDVEGPIRRLGAATAPTPYSPPLEQAVLPGSRAIADAIRRMLDD